MKTSFAIAVSQRGLVLQCSDCCCFDELSCVPQMRAAAVLASEQTLSFFAQSASATQQPLLCADPCLLILPLACGLAKSLIHAAPSSSSSQDMEAIESNADTILARLIA